MDSPNEDFWLQISYDGGATFTTIEEWNLGDEFENDQQENDIVVINGPFSDTTELRFRCHASTNSDWVYLDDIELSGCRIDGGVFRISNEDGSAIPTETKDRSSIPVETNVEVAKDSEVKFTNLKAQSTVNTVSEVRNFPNPLNDYTTIEFTLQESIPVSLVVSDLTGKQMNTIINDKQLIEGIHLIQFDGSNYPTGMYYYTIQAGENVITQKMSIIK